jgi:FO synthase
MPHAPGVAVGPGHDDGTSARIGRRLPALAPVISRDEAQRLIATPDPALDDLLARAGDMRDRGRGRVVTFSKKVFVPLTTLCRDYCQYCTFRRDPGEPGAHTMTPDEVVALVQAGARVGAKEALFSLGDKPEALFPEQREFLRRHGHRTTLGYLRAMSKLTLEASSLLPHANPGVMAERDLAALRDVTVSMGLMLESVSERLLAPGMAHDNAPDKLPSRRLKTIELAGKLAIPFTTGILIGIGETPEERVDALLAIRDLHERYGHVQEVIIQNFRAKPRIPMRDAPEPSHADLARTIAVARLVLGPEMNLQAPPNLSERTYGQLLAAGLNDWGGISPLTLDHINPEKPWPQIGALRHATEAAGFTLRERLAIYPEYAVRPEFLDESLRERVGAFVGSDGLVKESHEYWRSW